MSEISNINESQPHLQLSMEALDEPLQSIVFSDQLGLREITAFEIGELLNLKDQIQMMIDEGNEMGWAGIVEQATELEAVFKNTVRQLGIKI